MFIVNRGYIIVRPKQVFIDWANRMEPDFEIDADGEPTIYLIDEEFYDDELMLQQNFKRIFLNELDAVSDDESSFPEVKLEVFKEWFTVELGSTVFDSLKKGLDRD